MSSHTQSRPCDAARNGHPPPMPAGSPSDHPPTGPVELRVLLKGSSDASAPTDVWITPHALRENRPVAATIGRGAVRLCFDGCGVGYSEYFCHLDFKNATGAIYKFDETTPRYKWTSVVRITHVDNLRDGGTQVFKVKYQWPDDGSDNRLKWGSVGVNDKPPFIEVLLRIPLLPSSRLPRACHPRQPDEPASPAPVEYYAGPYRNDGGDAVADWANTMTGRLRALALASASASLPQGFERNTGEFQERLNAFLVWNQPGEALNIWLRDPSRPPSAEELSRVRRALSGWLTMAAQLLSAWTRGGGGSTGRAACAASGSAPCAPRPTTTTSPTLSVSSASPTSLPDTSTGSTPCSRRSTCPKPSSSSIKTTSPGSSPLPLTPSDCLRWLRKHGCPE